MTIDAAALASSMDSRSVAPAASANGRAVLLLHGRNFASSYWESAIKALTGAGYRVIVPDQVGFGKSSKPLDRKSFEDLARLSNRDLQSLLREVDAKMLVVALKGCTPVVRDRVLENMSMRARENLVEELELTGSVKLSAIKEAHDAIAQLTLRMIQEDRIMPPEGMGG